MKKEVRKFYTGERALFAVKDMHLQECTFDAGESPLKESSNLLLDNCLFKWKYPLWYSKDIVLNNCTLFDTARAGIWYTDNITFNNCVIEAVKSFRRATRVTLNNVVIPNASETLWNCEHVSLKSVQAQGTYFAMGCKNITCEDFVLTGDYCFDSAENVTIRRAKLLSKDSFWNCKNVTVYDSFISGEYLAWNAENVTFVNCTIESLQGLCYVKNLKLVNCKLINTTRSFEYSTVDAEIVGHVDSIVNPTSGRIVADSIGELVLDDSYIDPSKTTVELRKK
ncbi:MAG: DUF3737 family protein [Clostridiales bacterium]|nr:DUF3737 family protein [Clostridiales bacterium]